MLLDYQRTFAWQYRYDTARARYMRRMLDPETLVRVDTEWSDYGGDWIYADWKMIAIGDGDKATDGGDGKLPGTFDRIAIAEPGDGSDNGEDPTEPSTVRHYLTGIAHIDVGTDGVWDEQAYYHGNQISSTRLLTNGAGAVVRDLGYTAFGEEVDLGGEVGTRYRYAGVWGYESHDDFPFLHVGARWYDPETGRFLQRDPIGIRGGLNCYEYVLSRPTTRLDPTGLWYVLGSWIWLDGFASQSEDTAYRAGCHLSNLIHGQKGAGLENYPREDWPEPGGEPRPMKSLGEYFGDVKTAVRKAWRDTKNATRDFAYDFMDDFSDWWNGGQPYPL